MVKMSIRSCVGAAVLSVALSFLLTTQSNADQSGASVWQDVPDVSSSMQLLGVSDPIYACTSATTYGIVAGNSTVEPLCLAQSFEGTTIAYDAGKTQTLVRFSGSGVFRQLYNCAVRSCWYDGALDVIVTRQRLAIPYGYQLVIYKHARARLLQQGAGYSFDLTNPDHTLWRADGSAFALGSMAVSSNGAWLAMEVIGEGIAVMDLTTFQVKMVDASSYRYGVGYDPSMELAVSNDGGAVAMVGMNVRAVVITVTDSCGRNPLLAPGLDTRPMCAQAANAEVAMQLYQPGFAIAGQPSFNTDGSQLRVAAVYWPNQVTLLTLSAQAPAAGANVGYLALGDSYSSGEGETDDNYYIDGTNQDLEKCHTSRRSYPFLVGSLQGVPVVHSVACSGAVITDIAPSTDTYEGQNGRLHSFDEAQRQARKSEALLSYVPGRLPQSRFVEQYHPAVVTVGIGGNDAGFMDKIQSCLMPDECEWATPKGVAETNAEIARQFDRVVALYQQLHLVSPNSHIYAVGYPQIIQPSGGCGDVMARLLQSDERKLIANSIHYLNMVIEAAARKAGVMYLDVESAYGGHVLCGTESQLAVNGLQLGDDLSIADTLTAVPIIGNETFHPTPLGHSLVAGRIAARGNLASLVGDCGEIFCPHPASEVPSPPQGGEVPEASGVEVVRTGDMVSDKVVHIGSSFTVTLYPGALKPHSVARIEIHSQPTELAMTTSDQDGAVVSHLELPATITPGYHTLHVIGVSYDDQPIDRYQTILVLNPERAGSPMEGSISGTVASAGENTTTLKAGGSLLAASHSLGQDPEVAPAPPQTPQTLVGSAVRGVSTSQAHDPQPVHHATSFNDKLIVAIAALAGAITMIALLCWRPSGSKID